MKIFLLVFYISMLSACLPAHYYRSSDLTAENSFSQNCEGPCVDASGNLYVVNFERDGTVGMVTPAGEASTFVVLPEGGTANSIRFNSRGGMLLADFTGHNILLVDMATRQMSVFCHDERFNQPNDICVAPNDIIYASDPNWKDGSGQLWRIDTNGQATLLEGNMGTTNGIELSPDGRILYVNESVQRLIWAYDVQSNGNLANKRLFTRFDDHGLDGMKCDLQGNLYIARYGKGVVAVFSPQGKLLREIPVKGKQVSNLTFGGKDGRTVFVTLQDRRCVEQFRNPIAGK